MFATSEELWAACCEYFEKVAENPLYEPKLVSYEGISQIEVAPEGSSSCPPAQCVVSSA